MLLRRALPEVKTPAPSFRLNFLTAPKVPLLGFSCLRSPDGNISAIMFTVALPRRRSW